MGGIELHEMNDEAALTMFERRDDRSAHPATHHTQPRPEPTVQSWLMDAFAQERAPQPARLRPIAPAARWSMPAVRVNYVQLLTVMLLTWWLA